MQSQSETFTPGDIPDLSGRVFLVTGGTAGLGAGSIALLAKKNPAHIFFSGRNTKRADELIAKVKKESPDVPITFVHCDLADLQSVKKASDEILAKTDRLDVFYANAGIMGTDPGLTKDGYEVQFGTNHMGHALMIKKLLPLLERTAKKPNADVRIINMSSVAYKRGPQNGIDFDTIKTTQPSLGGMIPGPRWSRYGQSKLANLLYAQQLAKRYPQITTVSVHPGFIKTDLWGSVPLLAMLPLYVMVPLDEGWTDVQKGPYNQTWAGTTARGNLENGAYYAPIAKKGSLVTDASKDSQLAAKLWNWTQKELEAYS